MKHHPEQMKLTVIIAQPVAMSQEELLSVNLARLRFPVQNHSTFFLQIITTPDIVVSDEEMHFHSPVGQFRQFAQETGISLRHNQLEFVPKVEHIPQEIHSRSPFLNTVEEIDQTAFLSAAMRNSPRA